METAAEAAESWYQLPAEEDASVAFPTLGDTVARAEHTDFPSLEEGTLLSELRSGFSAGRTHALQLDVQDSRLSPCLPLLPDRSSPGHHIWEDSLFQKTTMDDFAPLRASLDFSQFPGPPSKSLQMSDAVELANKEITMDHGEEGNFVFQQYLKTTQGGGGDGGRSHPLSRGDEADTELESSVLKLTSPDDIIEKDSGPEREDGLFLGSSVPAPVLLGLLEKEVGMSSNSGRSSRCSSKLSSAEGSENTNGQKQEPDPGRQNLSTADPRKTSHQLIEESFRDSSEIDFENVESETEDANEFSQRHQSGVTLRPLRTTLHQQLCSEIQQRYQEKQTSDATMSRNEAIGLEITPVFRKSQTEETSKVEDAVVQAQLRDELSMSSRGSIERGHKDTEMSHAGNTPVDEDSFLCRLPNPISQSTPGTFTMNRKQLSGRIQQIKAKLTGSDMSLHEEPSAETSRHNVAASAMPQSIQSSQGYPESSDSQRSLSPQRRRIQSLPSLNYIEKVGAWNTNTNQSFDALVLRGLTGVSPKKLAYNAVADSLNRMLSKQTSTTVPKKGLSASFKATSSMTNLSVAEKESSSKITRSQSYNSVLSGRDLPEMDRQPVEEVQEISKPEVSHTHVLPRSSSSASSKWVENNIRVSSVGGHNLPSEQTSSELKDHSRRGPEVTSKTPSRSFVTLDPFSDVSLDKDFSSSSQSSNHEEKLLSSVTSVERDLTGGGDDWSCPEETSGKEELNIEERIPTYLRNLGIDQSPTSILAPFAPKGPIREPEFSPTELRTIKGSTATPSRSMRLSEGGSQSAVNVSQSSLYSSTSTTSVSIPMGSEVGPESPLPTDSSPPFGSGSGIDRPISQDDTMARGLGQDLAGLSPCVEMAEATQPTDDLTSSTAAQNVLIDDSVGSEQERQLISEMKSAGTDETSSQDNEQATSSQGYPMRPPTRNPVNDSFVGSNTLKEIQKLWAEADVSLHRTMSTSHRTSPLGDPYTEDPRCLNLEESLNSRSASPLDLQVKDISWDSSFNSGSTGDHLKDSSVAWKNDSLHSSARDHSYGGDLVGSRSAQPAPFSLQRQLGRSEPEGCSKATANKAMPPNGRVDVTGRERRAEQLLSNVSSSVGVLRNALAVTGTGHLTGKEAESDDSSGDSLAARVTSLLKSDAPMAYTARARQRADEEERRARGSVKLKLASPSMTPDTELSEEDRRRIEEIKRELLGRAMEAEKGYSHPDKPGSSGDAGEFSLRLTPSPFLLPITGCCDPVHDLKSATIEAQPNVTYRAMTKDESSVEADQSPSISAPYREEALRRDVCETEEHDVLPGKSTEEVTKPISSITFSSRKRSPPLSTSPDGGSPPLLAVLHKSPASQGSKLHPPPAPSHNAHYFHHEDTPPSRLGDVDPALWRPSECSTQKLSARSWAAEYPTAATTQHTSAPSERFTAFPHPQKENMDPEKENMNLEDSLVINRDLPMSNGGGDDPLTCRGLEAAGDGSHPSSSQDFQPKPTISSPTLKALSCLHVTISPKDDMKVLNVSRALVTSGIEDASWSSSPDLSSKDLSHKDHSAGSAPLIRPRLTPTADSKGIHEHGVQFMGKENFPDRSILSDRRRSPLSDATTQITTESPEKTTFSAEIFVEGSVREASTSSIGKVSPTPERQQTPRAPMSCLSRATDQPLLLPYRPPGSPELFYVPFMEAGSRMSPVSTAESSHPGSNDAISPKFPPDIMGSASEKLPDPHIPRHREGIYSKEPSLTPARGPADDLQSSRHPSAPLSSLAEEDSGNLSKMSFSPLHPESRETSDPRGWQPYPASAPEDDHFLPLQPEIDYPQEQSDINLQVGSEAATVRTRKETVTYTAGRTPTLTPGGLSHKSAQTPGGLSHKSAQTAGGLSHKSAQTPVGLSHKSAQTPVGLSHKSAHTPVGLSHKSVQTPGGRSCSPSSSPERSFSRPQSVVSHPSLDDLWARYTENRTRVTQSSRDVEVSLVERLERLARLLQNLPPGSQRPSTEEQSLQKRETKKSAREQWYRRKLAEDSVPDDGSVGKSYEDSPDSGSLQSDPMSEVGGTVTTASTESQVGSEASSMTSTSMSTIDTIRLINAFGPGRVLPSSRLGRLYSTINLQKKLTEETARGWRRAPAGRGTEVQELRRSQTKMADAESGASSNCVWEPSPALRQKRSSRRLNKGVQAGELEIVMSGTKKNTRDVGTTFPSPGGERLTTTTAVNEVPNTRASRRKVTIAAPHIPPGLSWFVPAENLKSESRKENEPRMRRGPGLAWYQPVTSTKRWREPLREKNEQDGVSGRPDGPIHRDIPSTKDKPFIRVTLQESLRSHRPDFIFRSGERVKRLQLLAEERKLQSVFQDERDQLFNQRSRSAALRNKDSRLSQQNRTIPKKEMIQRSKRIYEQLPEIRKRKEEEKRRSEYETNRLKAQLFRKKVTNRILGRKTPWN